jgi:hypothetical protein
MQHDLLRGPGGLVGQKDEAQRRTASAAGKGPRQREVAAALERVLASAAFRSSRRLAAFLRFIVERALAGEGGRIKGYTIAVEALGRGPDFDPQSDPIVRVDAGRLRRALARFYAAEGADDPILIALPRGSYVPTFRRRAAREPALRGVSSDELDRPAPRDVEVLNDTLQRLIALCRLQQQAIATEVALAEQLMQWSRELTGSAADIVAACRTGSRLLPTAPSVRAVARPADGRKVRKERKIEQAEGAPAARPRRPRAG